MRPFEKDSQSVVTKGRRKTKLAAPKSKSAAAALIKRKNRNIRNKKENNQDDTTTDNQYFNYNCNVTKEQPCHFVPVRRKPLGEYMKLEKVPMGSPSPSLPSMQGMHSQGMRMSYAAAVETGSGSGSGVKVMISPRLNNKPNTSSNSKSGKASKANKITADTKFRIFDEQPKKPHIVRVDPKLFEQKSRMKNSKLKKPIPQKTNKPQLRITSQSDPNDVDIKALQLQLNIEMECNAASAATVAIKGNTLSASKGQEQRHVPVPDSPPTFADSVSYLSYHRERLQRMIKSQQICAICLQTPEEPMKIPQFEDKHFKCLEEAALLAQNRTMLRLWMNSDQLIC
ncbi:hypothetical protein ACLKA6_005261 [Drosophila palustris]